MTLKVIDPRGASISGYGSRQAGESFEMPADLEQQYAQAYPDRFTIVIETSEVEASIDETLAKEQHGH